MSYLVSVEQGPILSEEPLAAYCPGQLSIAGGSNLPDWHISGDVQAHHPFRFIDLFAGIGGFRVAFEALGGECVFSSEWNSYAARTYEANFGELPYGDITLSSTKDAIPDHELLCAGFPCQPFSIAGVSKHNALGRAHGFGHPTQGTLFFEVVEIIRRHRPAMFLLENVKNLMSHDGGRTFDVITKALRDELGYSVSWSVIDAAALVPQHRERIFLVGFREPTAFTFPVLSQRGPVLGNILEHDVDSRYTLSDKLWVYLQEYAAKHRAKGNGFGFGLADLGGVSRTLSARYYKDGSEILIPQDAANPRRLTPRECARLMGYPEDFRIVVSDTQAYKQFGNSVVVPVVAAVGEAMLEAFERSESDANRAVCA
jgi:DNA (cytosine-5)-methyltransferase 1